MPRKRTSWSGINPNLAPLTAEDARNLFLQADRHNRQPEEADCQEVADILSASMPSKDSVSVLSQDSRRATDAARELGKFLKRRVYFGPQHESLARLYHLLVEAEPYLDPQAPALRPIAPDQSASSAGKRLTGIENKPWSLAASIAASTYTRFLIAEGRASSRHRDSATVAFTVAAVNRMGFPGVGANSVATLLTWLARAEETDKSSRKKNPGVLSSSDRPADNPNVSQRRTTRRKPSGDRE